MRSLGHMEPTYQLSSRAGLHQLIDSNIWVASRLANSRSIRIELWNIESLHFMIVSQGDLKCISIARSGTANDVTYMA